LLLGPDIATVPLDVYDAVIKSHIWMCVWSETGGPLFISIPTRDTI